MNRRSWLPVALCCVPGVAGVAIVLGSLILGGAAWTQVRSAPWVAGVLVLGVLVCPLAMASMIQIRRRTSEVGREDRAMIDCCPPGDLPNVDRGQNLEARLSEVRAEGRALELEIAEQAGRDSSPAN